MTFKTQKLFLIFFVLFIFNINSGYSQNELDTVKYSILFDSPEKGIYSIDLGMGLSFNKYDTSPVGFIFGIDGTLLQPKFAINFNARIYYEDFDEPSLTDEPLITSVYKTQWSRNASLTGTYFFLQKKTNANINVLLKAVSRMRTSTHYVIKVPATTLTRYGFDFGYTAGFANYGIMGSDFEKKDGTQFTLPRSVPVRSVLNYGFLRIGISRYNSLMLNVKTDSYGEKSTSGSTSLYGHVLIPIKQELEDVNTEIDPFKINSEMANFGIAFGYVNHDYHWSWKRKKRSMKWGVEVGILPGQKHLINNWFIDFKLKFGIWNFTNKIDL